MSLSFLKDGVTQVAWVVEDADRWVEWFHSLTGIGPWHFYLYGDPLLKCMKRYGTNADYAMLAAVTNAGPTRLEVVQPVKGDTVFSEYVRKHGYGRIQHFGVAVSDMSSAVAQANDAGYHIVMEGSGYGLDGDGHFAYLDTEETLGIMVELMERPRRRHPPLRVYPQE